jgi:hypothetical protein
MPLSELMSTPGVRVGALGPLVVTVFSESPSLAMLTEVEAVQTRHAGQFGNRLLLCNVVTVPKLSPPPPEVREFSSKMQQRLEACSVGSATVLRMSGLSAVLARGFLAGLALITHTNRPSGVFKDPDEAVAWLLKLPGGEVLAREPDVAKAVRGWIG